MKTQPQRTGISIAVAALLAFGCASVLAQNSASPVSREEVKAETRAANKAGAIPYGQGVNKQSNVIPPRDGNVARGEVKSEARAANQAGTIPYGQGVNKRANAIPPRDGSVARGEVKADAKPMRRPFGETGERSDVVTNPANGTGTPK